MKMKRLLLFLSLLLGLSLSAFAQAQQSNLPPCPPPDYSNDIHALRYGKWHNCYGKIVFQLDYANKGDTYEGEFRSGRPDGQGTYAYANGDKYVGQFFYGLYNGRGKFIYADGHVIEGIWAHSQFVSAEKINLSPLPQKTEIEINSELRRLVAEQRVISKLPQCPTGDSGNKYPWWDNCFGRERKGKNIYIGEWKNGSYNGLGSLTYPDGRVQEGIFENGNFVRAEKITQLNDIALNDERRRLDADRQALEVERQRLTEERNRREQSKQSSKLSLQTTTTNPDANGVVIINVRTNADTSSLKVNGEEQGGKSDGNYTIKRVARVGQDTQFTITAVDIIGNTDTTTITVTRQAVSSSSNQSASLKPENIKRAPARDAVAIIIGIQNYKRVPKADFANNDAKEFYEYAIRGLGIKPENIKLLLDEEADEVNIVKAFENWLPLQVNKGKTDVYVFYSGHGLPSSDGKSLYFLPHGVDKELLSRTAVGQAEVVSALVASKPKSVTMFIDACYSGQTRGGETLLASAKPIALKTDTNAFPTNFTVITASANDQISSSSPELKHGIFSFYLMKGMEGDADGNKDGKITAGEMLEYLQDKVSRQAMSMSRKQDTQLVGDANKVLMGK
jgi:hypothetical protein